MNLSKRYTQAVAYARECHHGQRRKGTDIPYVSHPLVVSSLVMEYGGTETEAIAGLLHDVVEDGGAHTIPVIEDRFGAEVLNIVLECSDAVPAKGEVKPSWVTRKLRYIEKVPSKSQGALLVTACDKLHNLTAIVRDWHAHGADLWTRFKPGAVGTRWYYENLAQVLLDLDVSPAGDIERKLGELGWNARTSPMPKNLPPAAL